jgi:type IV secretory pathway ATPase VirB11/archaellum biosynthesis ATPase
MIADAVERLRDTMAGQIGGGMTCMDADDARAILDHITALTAERDAAVAEVGQIVARLRKEAIMSTDTVRRRMNEALDQIAAGAHKQENQR